MRYTIVVAAISTLSGCSEAAGAAIDPASDIDCSVVAFYYSGLAAHEGAPVDQQRATKIVHEWYAAKVRDIAVQSGDPQAVLSKAAPILDVIKHDPKGMAGNLQTCADRAIGDPSFNAFADTQGWKS
jgi:hypothetical protein